MTRPHTTGTRLRGTQTRAPRVSAEVVAALVYRLTARDRRLLALVWEHRVLTTGQLTRLYFPSPERARQRLNHLYNHHALLRFRPWTPVGSTPWHWVLGPAGAHVLAVEHGQTVTEFGYRQDTATAIAVSPLLTHQTGVNEFFVSLQARARRQGGAVEQWWSERRCAALWGDLARPDAFGRWTEPRPGSTTTTTVDFFLEHDTGTETLARVARKLGGYADLAEATGTTTPVLIWLPSPKRETNLRVLLGNPEVPVATAVHTPATSPDGPAGPVWLPAGTTGRRLRLADLATFWGTVPRHESETG